MKNEYVLLGLSWSGPLREEIEEEFNTGIHLKEYSYKDLVRTNYYAILSSEDVVMFKLKYGDKIKLETPAGYQVHLQNAHKQVSLMASILDEAFDVSNFIRDYTKRINIT